MSVVVVVPVDRGLEEAVMGMLLPAMVTQSLRPKVRSHYS